LALIGCGALVLIACATLASEAGDTDAVRPNAHAGPFRYVRDNEVPGSAPFVLRRKHFNFRDATVLAEGDGVVLYAHAELAVGAGIYRFLSVDGVSFDETPEPPSPVIAADQSWEGSFVGAPAVARVGDQVLLAYATEQGIGVARSSDGIAFDKADGLALSPADAPAWEGGEVPGAPALVALSPSDVRLFYEASGQIGEAQSTDGLSFARLSNAPVFGPSGIAGEHDEHAVGDPEALRVTSAEGRSVLRVYHTAVAADGSTAIGLAARFGAQGLLTRAPAAALAGPRSPTAPALLPRGETALLYVTQRATTSTEDAFPAIAAAVAPATARLPER
jgi:hypothetical protein